MSDYVDEHNGVSENKSNQFSGSFFKSALRVFVSNLILLIAGLVSGLFVPKLLPTIDYGYFKTFSLYSGYATFLQFGLVNGVFLIYGGKNAEELNKEKFRFFTRTLFAIELLVSIIMVAIAFIFLKGVYSEILLFLAIYSFVINCMTYFQQLLQITQQFKKYSIRTIAQAVLKIVAVLALWVMYLLKLNHLVSFEFYTICYVLIFVILFIWLCITFRHYIFGKCSSFKDIKKDVWKLFLFGFPLLIADFIVVLIGSSRSQIVNIFFTTEEFAYFSFAASILTLITTAVSAVSTVLYPALKRINEKELSDTYNKASSILLIVGFLCLISFYPTTFIINHFLPQYYSSIEILKVCLPGVVITSIISIVIQNYYKTLNKNIDYFIICLIVLGVSIGLGVGAYYLFKSMLAISVASIIAFFIWLIISQLRLKKRIQIHIWRNTIYAILMTSLFLFCVFFISDPISSLLVYLVVYLTTTLLVFPLEIGELFKSISRKIKKKNYSVEYGFADNKRISTFSTLKKSRKSITSILFLSITSSCLFFFGGSILFFNANSTISSFVYNQRNESNQFTYMSISSNDPSDNFNDFRNNSLDMIGVDLSKTNSVCFHSLGDEQHAAFKTHSLDTGDVVYSQAISTYTYSYERQKDNFGFEVLTGADFIEDQNAKHIYVTQDLADDIIGSSDLTYDDLLLQPIEATCSRSGPTNNYYFDILGVISSESLGRFKDVYGTKFILCQYNACLYYFNNLRIDCFMFGDKAETTAFINVTNRIIDYFDNYSMTFYQRDNNGKFYAGSINRTIINTIVFSKSWARYLIGIFGCLLSLLPSLFILKIVRNKYIFEKENSKFWMYVLPCCFLIAFAISYIIVARISGLVLFGLVISIDGYLPTTIMFAIAVFLSFLAIYLFGKKKQKTIDDYTTIHFLEIEC